MRVPSVIEAEKLICKAEQLNPGIWIQHSKVTARCAKTIAEKCTNMDSGNAFVLGLLHDIGRQVGVCALRHVLTGYQYMLEKGYDDVARICLTHSFPIKNIHASSGENDISPEEINYLQEKLNEIEYTDYDKLIQLCDCIAFHTGPCVIEKRLIDVSIRRGINEFSIEKWKAYLSLRTYFEAKIGCNL